MSIYEGWTRGPDLSTQQLTRIRNMADELKRLDPAKYEASRLFALQDVLNWDGIETYLTQELKELADAELAAADKLTYDPSVYQGSKTLILGQISRAADAKKTYLDFLNNGGKEND